MAGSTTQLILTFDQYRQDQMICFQHGDNSGDRFAGIHIWDRSDLPLNEWAERFRHIWEQPSGLKKEAELRQLRADGHLPAQRVFIGKQPNRAAAVSLHDAQGRVRLRLSVAEEGTSAIEFLDEDGEVIGRFPEPEYREQLDS